VVPLVVRLRNRRHRAEGGLIGARALRQELRAPRLARTVPALSTLTRWLKAAGLRAGGAAEPKSPCSPAPAIGRAFAFAPWDWTTRSLEGGEQVFVFHPVDVHPHARAQTSRRAKTTTSVGGHLLHAGAEVGVPAFLQIDHAAAFTGLGKPPEAWGRFVRLALAVGRELSFMPPGAPERTYLVEGVNPLWAQSFWSKHSFASDPAFQRKSPQFLAG